MASAKLNKIPLGCDAIFWKQGHKWYNSSIQPLKSLDAQLFCWSAASCYAMYVKKINKKVEGIEEWESYFKTG